MSDCEHCGSTDHRGAEHWQVVVVEGWWLIPARRGGRCDSCGNLDVRFAYNHAAHQVLCQCCAEAAGVWDIAQPSKRYLKAEQTGAV
jgi:hypothetical protein